MLLSWSRALILALLCAMICAPGALHARICFVALGVIEQPSCCSKPTCCDPLPDKGPALAAASEECTCCLEVVFDSNDKTPTAAPVQLPALEAPMLRLVCVLASVPPPAPGFESQRAIRARERLRPNAAAQVPLRI